MLWGGVFLIAVATCVSTVNVSNLFISERKLQNQNEQTRQFISNAEADTIIFDNGFYYEVMITAMPNDNYCVLQGSPQTVHLDDVFGKKQQISYENLIQKLQNAEKVIFVASDSNNLKKLDEHKIEYRLVGNFMVDDISGLYPFYELYLQ